MILSKGDWIKLFLDKHILFQITEVDQELSEILSARKQSLGEKTRFCISAEEKRNSETWQGEKLCSTFNF